MLFLVKVYPEEPQPLDLEDQVMADSMNEIFFQKILG
jgi:hypothetical protein